METIIVSKRRNLKKEKAARNQAYARQFRKKFSRSSNSRNQNSGNSAKSSGGQKQTAAS